MGAAELQFAVKAVDNASGTLKNVGEQSGIRAGDGGFQVNVKGDTTLVGGAITSTDKAVNEGKNSFTTGGKASLAIPSRAAEMSCTADTFLPK